MNASKLCLLATTWVLTATWAVAQLTASNIYLCDLETTSYTVTNPAFLTSDNSARYNNQPAFIGNRLYTASLRNASGTTDIFAYDFKDAAVFQVTDTKMSEYSPTLMPDGKYFSTVCIEADGKTQRLWKFPLNMQGQGTLLLKDVQNVGYHAWLDKNRLILFVVGTPNTLQIVEVSTQKRQIIASDVARGVQVYQGEIYYIQRSPDDNKHLLRRLDVENMDLVTIKQTLPDSEDFIILPDGAILMGSGSKLFKLMPFEDDDWQLIADFSRLNVRKITRLAFQAGKLAVVAN